MMKRLALFLLLGVTMGIIGGCSGGSPNLQDKTILAGEDFAAALTARGANLTQIRVNDQDLGLAGVTPLAYYTQAYQHDCYRTGEALMAKNLLILDLPRTISSDHRYDDYIDQATWEMLMDAISQDIYDIKSYSQVV